MNAALGKRNCYRRAYFGFVYFHFFLHRAKDGVNADIHLFALLRKQV